MRNFGQISRRGFLQNSLLGVTGIAAFCHDAETSLADRGNSGTGWIDAHSHIWTRELKRFPLAKGRTVQDLDPPSFTTEELIKTASPEGVDRVVLIQHHIFYGWDNSYMTDATRRYPDKFRVVGMVDDTARLPGQAMRKLLRHKVTGFRITPRIRGKDQWLEGPGMAAMWRCAAETRQAICCLIDSGDLPAVDAMCRKYPDTPVVIDHFARIGVDGTIRDADVKALCGLAKHKRTFVKISAFYALGKKKPPYLDLIPLIRQVYEAFGPQRLMWASDAPYQIVDGHTYKASISLVRDRLDFLSDVDRTWLLRGTAEKVYFFDA
jgi:predicted TIM-barrel fold metal-dependent hydrolase